MAHNLNMTAIRHFAYVLVKVFKALFQRVYVNEEGVQMVGEFFTITNTHAFLMIILGCSVETKAKLSKEVIDHGAHPINERT